MPVKLENRQENAVIQLETGFTVAHARAAEQDISSDGEPGLSPVDKSSVTTSSSLETVVTRALTTQLSEEEEVLLRCEIKRHGDIEARNRISSPRLSPVKERIPSRYSFNNTS